MIGAAPQNKGMKLTSAERIGRSQLIPGVVPTTRGAARGSSPGRGHGARVWELHEVAAPPPQDLVDSLAGWLSQIGLLGG